MEPKSSHVEIVLKKDSLSKSEEDRVGASHLYVTR